MKRCYVTLLEKNCLLKLLKYAGVVHIYQNILSFQVTFKINKSDAATNEVVNSLNCGLGVDVNLKL